MDGTLPSGNGLAQGCRTGSNGSGRVPTGNEAPFERRVGGRPRVLAVAPLSVSPRKQAAQFPTCRAQPARREWREDCAGSSDSDEDEGAEALAGFFRLVVEMWGVFCGRI